MKMELITIESNAYKEIIGRIDRIENRFIDLLRKARNPFEDRWVDSQTASELLCITKRTLQTYRDDGVLPFTTLEGKIFFKTADIEALLKANYQCNEKKVK